MDFVEIYSDGPLIAMFSGLLFLFISYQVLNALDYCHSLYIIHLDLQPKNILVCDNEKIKITNFKSANLLSYPINVHMYNGKSWYTALEILLGVKGLLRL